MISWADPHSSRGWCPVLDLFSGWSLIELSSQTGRPPSHHEHRVREERNLRHLPERAGDFPLCVERGRLIVDLFAQQGQFVAVVRCRLMLMPVLMLTLVADAD